MMKQILLRGAQQKDDDEKKMKWSLFGKKGNSN